MRLSDAVSHSGLVVYAEIALVLFFVAFLVIVARLWWRRDRDEMERMRHLPLDDEPRGAPGRGARP